MKKIFTMLILCMLTAVPLFAANVKVVVFDMVPVDPDSAKDAAKISEIIFTGGKGKFTVVGRDQLAKAMKDLGRQAACNDLACAMEVGKHLGADGVIMGMVMRFGSGTTVKMQIVDVEKGKVDVEKKMNVDYSVPGLTSAADVAVNYFAKKADKLKEAEKAAADKELTKKEAEKKKEIDKKAAAEKELAKKEAEKKAAAEKELAKKEAEKKAAAEKEQARKEAELAKKEAAKKPGEKKAAKEVRTEETEESETYERESMRSMRSKKINLGVYWGVGVLFPGIGQLYADKRISGGLVFTAWLLNMNYLSFSTAWYLITQTPTSPWNKTIGKNKIATRHLNISILIMMGIYVYNVLDLGLISRPGSGEVAAVMDSISFPVASGEEYSKYDLYPRMPRSDAMMLQFSYRF